MLQNNRSNKLENYSLCEMKTHSYLGFVLWFYHKTYIPLVFQRYIIGTHVVVQRGIHGYIYYGDLGVVGGFHGT